MKESAEKAENLLVRLWMKLHQRSQQKELAGEEACFYKGMQLDAEHQEDEEEDFMYTERSEYM